MGYDAFCANCGGDLTSGPHANDYTCEPCGAAIDVLAAGANTNNDQNQNKCVVCGTDTIGSMEACYGCEDDARAQGLL